MATNVMDLREKRAVRPFAEAGTSGIEAWSGFIEKAYTSELYWPTCYPLFNRIRRSDPEIGGIVRPAYTTLVNDVHLDVDLPPDPSDDDKRFQEFVREVLEDIDGGQGQLLSTIAGYTPFLGWQWFDAPLARRIKGWKAPGDTSGWRSNYDDGLIGIRGFYHRDHSSFEKWEMSDKTGRITGMWQVDHPNDRALLPLDHALHLTFGDPTSPEGLSPLEAVWRLERIKYGLEVVQGIGYEHTAGYATFKVFQSLDPDSKALINRAARALLSAQEGNYITEIAEKFEARIIDTPFGAAPAILEAIRYYGILKLQVYNMQWVTMASTSGSGAFSAVQDSSSMFISSFNAMMSGFADQMDRQIGERLLRVNASAFPNITRRPRIITTSIEKTIPLGELAAFMRDIAAVIPLGDEDIIAVRRKSGFLPESLPEVEEAGVAVEEPEEVGEDELNDEEVAANDLAELAEAENLFTAKAKQVASDFADSASEDLRELYNAWLQETQTKLENEENEDRHDAIIAASLTILLARVKRLLNRIASLMGKTLDMDEDQQAAIDGVAAETLAYFEDNTLPRLRREMANADSKGFAAKFAGKGRDIALAGGVLWAGYIAAKLVGTSPTTMARWDGPNDAETCAPCAEQMRLGERPLRDIPLPGIGVCQGMSNCRHDIVLVR